MPRYLALCLPLLTAFLSAQNVHTGRTPAQAANLIQPADLKADLYFLASEDLAGRNAGSREDHIATDFIAAEFMRLGLKPMGDNGTFFQKVQILTGNPDKDKTTLTATINGVEHRYTYGQDFQWSRQSLRPASSCGEIVF